MLQTKHTKVKSYKELIVWQKAMELSLSVYRLTDKFPKSEQFGLINQIRRAVVSIPSNIAEGWARKGLGEYIHFLYVSYASASELETQLILSKKLNLGDKESYTKIESLLLEVQKLLYVIIKKLKNV